jgi:predicted TIM-barrel fold metal-dependent hydrolase
MTSATLSENQTSRVVQRIPIIDCDLHAELNSLQDLFPYLSARWQRHIELFGAPKYGGGFYPRYFDHRAEARPPSGRKSGSDASFTSSDHLDRHNVVFGILNTLSEVNSLTNHDLDSALATAINEWLTEEWLDRDARMRATMSIPCEDPARAVEEIAMRAGDKRFVQVQFSGRPHEPMGRRKYWPIYEACAEHGLVVMSHAFGAAGNPISGAGWPSYYIEDHIGPAVAIQANVTSMVLEGVFEHFPSLKLISVENTFGWAPSLAWRMDNAWKILKEEVPHLKRLPSEYLAEHVYLATQPIEEPPHRRWFDQLFEHYPAYRERLVFSTDYPHWDADSPTSALSYIRSEELKHRIFNENARELYNLT